MGPQSHNLRAKLDEIPDILPVEYDMFGDFHSSIAPHIERRVIKYKVYLSKQTFSILHLMQFIQLPNACVALTHRAYIALENGANAVQIFSLSSEWAAGTPVFDTSSPQALLRVEAEQFSMTNEPQKTPHAW